MLIPIAQLRLAADQTMELVGDVATRLEWVGAIAAGFDCHRIVALVVPLLEAVVEPVKQPGLFERQSLGWNSDLLRAVVSAAHGDGRLTTRRTNSRTNYKFRLRDFPTVDVLLKGVKAEEIDVKLEPYGHLCHAPSCDLPVNPRMFACPQHWLMVPKGLQAALWSEYTTGQEIGKVASARYLAVQQTLVAYLAMREGHPQQQQHAERAARWAVEAGDDMVDWVKIATREWTR